MHAYILSFTEEALTAAGGMPVIRIVEERLRLSKRIEEVYTVIPRGQLKRYSLHTSNPVEVKAKNKLEALYKALPGSGEVFLVEGNMPLIMPFLVNYLSTLFLEGDSEALMPSWRDGTPEVTHAFYEAKPLKRALETCMAENEKKLSCIAKHLDYEKVSIEALSSRNPKVTLSFFKVRSSFDIKFVERTLGLI